MNRQNKRPATKQTVPSSIAPGRWQAAGICLALATLVFAVFGQTAGFQFVAHDDAAYVYQNPMVFNGLTGKGFVWALTFGEIGHWHPLTWLAHMADCQIYGLWAGGHHLTNVLLHAAAVILLFLTLREITGKLWRSAFVAAIFAIHPLRAESVAWIAELKDVLSGVFFMLTLLAYARYVREQSRGSYVRAIVAFALGLLSKNSLVTAPFVLLLLDWWPLGRMKPGALAPLLKEKIPFFLLSAASCVATFLAPEKVRIGFRIPFLERIGMAVVSYGIYLRQMVWPSPLSIPYVNLPGVPAVWEISLSLAVLVAISVVVWNCRARRPYLLAGWLWYMGMLVPMIGIVQISYYSHADRYTYLPGIGILLGATWLVADWSVKWKNREMILGSLMAAVTLALMAAAWIQTGYWEDNQTLWTHALECEPRNYVAHYNLGNGVFDQGKIDEAIGHFQMALQIEPLYDEAAYNLGNCYLQKGEVDKAIALYHAAIQLNPQYEKAYSNLGNALLRQGKLKDAVDCYEKALQIRPDFVEAHNDLGDVLLQLGRVDEAIAHCQRALELNPDDAGACVNLGNALYRQGKTSEAIAQFQRALQIDPQLEMARKNLDIVRRSTPEKMVK